MPMIYLQAMAHLRLIDALKDKYAVVRGVEVKTSTYRMCETITITVEVPITVDTTGWYDRYIRKLKNATLKKYEKMVSKHLKESA